MCGYLSPDAAVVCENVKRVDRSAISVDPSTLSDQRSTGIQLPTHTLTHTHIANQQHTRGAHTTTDVHEAETVINSGVCQSAGVSVCCVQSCCHTSTYHTVTRPHLALSSSHSSTLSPKLWAPHCSDTTIVRILPAPPVAASLYRSPYLSSPLASSRPPSLSLSHWCARLLSLPSPASVVVCDSFKVLRVG